MRRVSPLRTELLLAMVSFATLLAACSQPTIPAGVLSLSLAHATSAHPLVIRLVHQPTGTADLTWDEHGKHLTVILHLTGLTPSSSHPAHIHQGNCQGNGGAMLFMLHPVVADAFGVGTSKTDLTGVNTGIAKSGWYINVHNGPNLTPADQFLPIACGNLPTQTLAQKLHIDLGGTVDQHASGQAQLSLQQNTLVVTVTMSGLVPGSAHMEHIHAGRCEHQGKIVYMLQNLVADKNGNAKATTRIPKVKQIPAKVWYLNVHRTSVLTSPNGQINPTNFDPIACSNIGD